MFAGPDFYLPKNSGFDRSVTVALGLSLLFCASKEVKPRTGKPRGVTR
ncbi:hypothetical protein SLEP1_g50645 [Rubroshorea leprosula]|uniref:Uncharacterized protein n=1 Tax=Rubroshorea leprosula TaxID=152421 RepID=A0AAV5M3W0_9ROSI|nr:hypothetical protein SLEP1_g50645 [Rubroshorea leprosula]